MTLRPLVLGLAFVAPLLSGCDSTTPPGPTPEQLAAEEAAREEERRQQIEKLRADWIAKADVTKGMFLDELIQAELDGYVVLLEQYAKLPAESKEGIDVDVHYAGQWRGAAPCSSRYSLRGRRKESNCRAQAADQGHLLEADRRAHAPRCGGQRVHGGRDQDVLDRLGGGRLGHRRQRAAHGRRADHGRRQGRGSPRRTRAVQGRVRPGGTPAKTGKAFIATYASIAQGQYEDRQRRETAERNEYLGISSSSSSASGAGESISITLLNDCDNRMEWFHGDDPKYGKGRRESLSANSRTSSYFTVGRKLWLLDGEGKEIAYVTVNKFDKELEFDCSSITRR